MPAVEEANSISEELDKRVKFEIILIRLVFLCQIVLEFLNIEKQFFIAVNLISMFHLLSPHMLGKMQGTTKAKVEVMLLCTCLKPLDPYPEPWTRKYNIIIKYLILTRKYDHCQLFNLRIFFSQGFDNMKSTQPEVMKSSKSLFYRLRRQL